MSTVYFIRSSAGPVKIGRSSDVEARVTQLQTANPNELRVVRTMPGGRDVERWFHRHFQSERLRGEWFRWTPEMETVEPQVHRATVRLTRSEKEALRLTSVIDEVSEPSLLRGHTVRQIVERASEIRQRLPSDDPEAA